MKTLSAGSAVPDFTLTDHNGKSFNFNQHRGRKLVIFFYPKDESAVCTKEVCAFRDSFSDFQELGATVIGINNGSIESHHTFAQKNRLPFTLLSDPDNKVLKSFGIKPVLFLTGRETFIVNEDGVVVFNYRAFLSGDAHPQKVLDFLKKS